MRMLKRTEPNMYSNKQKKKQNQSKEKKKLNKYFL